MIHRDTANLLPLWVPFQQLVTYYRRTADRGKPDSFQPIEQVRARNKRTDTHESYNGTQVPIVPESEWQIVRDELGCAPQVDDYLIDEDGVGWVVYGVVAKFQNQVFDLKTRKRV